MYRAALALSLLAAGCFGRPLDSSSPDAMPPGDQGLAGDAGSGSGDGANGPGMLFSSTLSILSLPPNYLPRSVVIADVTGDRLNDLVVGAMLNGPGVAYNAGVFVFAQTAAGTLAPPAYYPTGTAGYEQPTMLAVADLDGDGRLDVALAGYSDYRVLLQTADGQLGPPAVLKRKHIDDPELIATGDFDGDGRSDLIGVGFSTSYVEVWYQAEAFAAAHSFDCAHGGGDSIAVADLDGDGALDVAISSDNATAVCLLYQRSGTFMPGPPVPIIVQPTPCAIAATDADGDGRTDLLIVSSPLSGLGKYLDILSQGTSGQFTLESSLDTTWYPNGLLLADVDGDGRVDAVVPHSQELLVGIYRQLPFGGFADEETYTYSKPELQDDDTQRTAVGDLNGDGRPDIVSIAQDVTILYHR